MKTLLLRTDTAIFSTSHIPIEKHKSIAFFVALHILVFETAMIGRCGVTMYMSHLPEGPPLPTQLVVQLNNA